MSSAVGDDHGHGDGHDHAERRPPSAFPPATVERTDDQLGLAVWRVSLSGRTLVTYARDHLSVRTPSRPDFYDGNTLDLVAPPAPGALARWVERFADTVASLGARHVQLRWETPLPDDAPPEAPVPDAGLAAAAAELGLALHGFTVLLLDELAPGPGVPAELLPVEPPIAGCDPQVERRWHGATVLYRYEHGDTPEEWGDVDEGFTRWRAEVERELAIAGRAQLWLAVRHGVPVGRLSLVHDRQGLAIVDDVVVHPAHRRIGVASALTHRAVATHLAVLPGTRVGIAAEPATGADRLYRHLGFRPHATVWRAFRPPPG